MNIDQQRAQFLEQSQIVRVSFRGVSQIDPDELDEIVFVQELGALQGAAVSRQSFRKKDLQSGKTGHGTFFDGQPDFRRFTRTDLCRRVNADLWPRFRTEKIG